MTLTAYLLVFVFGLTTGMVIIFVSMKIHSGENIGIIEAIRGLFSLLPRRFGRAPEVNVETDGNGVGSAQAVDPREQSLYDSAQTIRSILLTLAANIQRTVKAASDSSLALGDVKSTINTLDLPTDLKDAHSLLMAEVDRVILSNAVLKSELAMSQTVLTEQQRQIDDLRTAVRIDGLTQLANRTYFDEKLHEMIALHKRYGDPFSLMMIDLDNFKEINDSYGHPAGDRILKGVALKIKASLRGSDFFARFGGDEYAVILVKTDAKAATDVAWKLCEEVRASRFILDAATLSMTLSIGVAEADGSDTEERLLERADAALYRAKAAGRNGVSVAEAR